MKIDKACFTVATVVGSSALIIGALLTMFVNSLFGEQHITRRHSLTPVDPQPVAQHVSQDNMQSAEVSANPVENKNAVEPDNAVLAKLTADSPPEPQPVAATPPLPVTDEDMATNEEAAANQDTPANDEIPVNEETPKEEKTEVTLAEPEPLIDSTVELETVPATNGERWAIQVATFSDWDRGRKLADELRNAGYETYLEGVERGNRKLCRVRIGPELDHGNAEEIRLRIASTYQLNGQVTPYP